MKKFTFCLLLVLAISVVSLKVISVSAYQDTRTSAEYRHGGGTGSYCSMTTRVEVTTGTGTALSGASYSKGTSLGYSFSLQTTPYRYHYSTYDNYGSNNTLSWMGGTTWDFQLWTTHSF